MKKKADIGFIGLAVMGQNLILNMNDHGYSIAALNLVGSTAHDFINGAAKGRKTIYATDTIQEFIQLLSRPRKIMLMIKAGSAVDETIEKLLPYLEQGDLVIDGGNSNYHDSMRRTSYLKEKGILFIGTGVSGGEEGARHGPSMMAGGNPDGWPLVKDIFQAIAARIDDGSACCEWMGSDGAGHYVKMVHNGIEYGDMQIICEAYFLLKNWLKLDHQQMQSIFSQWNKVELDSYLIEITADILGFQDKDGQPLVEKIMDKAGQKGTGKWTGISSFEMGIPVTLIAEAVFARCLSSLKEERKKASQILSGPSIEFQGNKEEFIDDIRKALLASKIVSYAQGYMLLKQASEDYNWQLDFGKIALVWRGGCIIRSVFLGKIKEAYDQNPHLENLMLDQYFQKILADCQQSWRKVVSQAIAAGIPVPAFSTALAFYDGYRTQFLPANLLQAQRDYFGAHTYERVDQPGQFYHTNWTGKGGDVSSGSYTV